MPIPGAPSPIINQADEEIGAYQADQQGKTDRGDQVEREGQTGRIGKVDPVGQDGTPDTDETSAPIRRDLLKQARSSNVPLKHLTALMSAVQLDLEHRPKEQIGYARLFDTTCSAGEAHWLDPMPLFNEINEILRRYLAPRQTITPIIDVLLTTAQSRVSPYAFLDYIVLPRLKQDRNWRRWGDTHLPVIRRIAEIVVQLRSEPPFDQAVIGSSGHRVLSDVFLVKYVAAAAVSRTPSELTKRVVDQLVNAWRGLPVRTHGFVVFLRLNFRPFLSIAGKKLDMARYLELVEEIQPIEQQLQENRLFHDGNRVFDATLYGSEPGTGIARREEQGFKAIHFLREFKAYLTVWRTLLQRQGGKGALGFVAHALQRTCEPTQAQLIATLVQNLRDRGGRHVYIWHVNRLLEQRAEDQSRWLEEVVLAGGAHPTYPRYDQLFQHNEFRHAQNALVGTALGLGLTSGATKGSMTPNGLLKLYLRQNPEAAEAVQRFKHNISNGDDRSWTGDDVAEFDGLEQSDERKQYLHALLLFATIRGFSGTYTRGVHTPTLKDLVSVYRPDPYPALLDYRHEFSRDQLMTRKEKTLRTKAKVKTDAIASAWRRITESQEAPPLEQVLGQQYRSITEQAAQSRESRGPEHKATRRLDSQRTALETVLDQWSQLSPMERLSAGLLIAGYYGRKADELRASVLAEVLRWVSSDPVERERLKYLYEDIDAEAITIQQTEYLVTALTDISERIPGDPEVSAWLEEPDEIATVLAPLALTKQKKVTPEALDAAFRAIVNLSTLAKELARWRELLEEETAANPAANEEEGNAGSIAHHKNPRYALFISRTAVDAYFGDMGGTCLSNSPHHVRNNGFLNVRLGDVNRGEIVGMAAFQFVPNRVPSLEKTGFWFSFAFNPLRTVTSGLTESQLSRLYEQFRRVMAHIHTVTGKPILIPGIAAYGVVSNDTSFAHLIIEYEKARGGRFVTDAYGFALQYQESVYAQALVVNSRDLVGRDDKGPRESNT